jgi:hypothetical protein
MGLLDDAIRQHLELKRKHGAGDEGLRKQETEALGPARRDFTAEPAQTAEPAAAAPPEAAPGDAAASDGLEPVPEPAGWLDEELDRAPFDAAAEAPPAPVAEPSAEVAPPPDEQLPAPDPAPAEEEQPPPPERRESDTPTEGFPALTREDEPPPEGEEDVLEETPDFLQDTPEHDRLWFEQKPPRDFDFDG